MGAVLATPIIDENIPQFIDESGVRLEATRYVWFPGDVLGSRRKSEMKNVFSLGIKINGEPFAPFRNGGDEMGHPCLLRTKGVVPRAFFTPVETAAVFMPAELMPAGARTVRPMVDDAFGRGTSMHLTSWRDALPGMKVFPGEALPVMLGVVRNDQGLSRGHVEITGLQDVEFADLEKAGFQHFFFPDFPVLPVTLRGIEEAITKAIGNTSESSLRGIGEEMLAGCEQFRNWALDRIGEEENLVRTGTTEGGYTYRFSDVVESLMTQLEYTRQDRSVAEMARLNAQLGQQIGTALTARAEETKVPIEDYLDKLSANQSLLADAIGKIVDKLTATDETKPAAPTKGAKK